MRKYPEWAMLKVKAVRRSTAVHDNIICETHRPQKGTTFLPLNCEVRDNDKPVTTLCHTILKMGKEIARGLVRTVADLIPAGKILKAFVKYHMGIQMENEKTISLLPCSKLPQQDKIIKADTPTMQHDHTCEGAPDCNGSNAI